MQINLLEYLEYTCRSQLRDKTAFWSGQDSVTFEQLRLSAQRIGSYLSHILTPRSPVIIFVDKNIETILSYLGVLYAGCYYVPVGLDLPKYRIEQILDTVQAQILITTTPQALEGIQFSGQLVTVQSLLETPIDRESLSQIRRAALDIDPAYVIFTSGSTGAPKGVLESHRAVIDYIDAFAQTFSIGEDEIIGNQAPLDYIAAIRDIYLPLKTGASTVLLPKRWFSLPMKLCQAIETFGITTLCWVSSALCLFADFHAFTYGGLGSIRKVFFTGSVLPNKYLRQWQQELPAAMFVNHYGPTEITASCTYYILDRPIELDDALPIGIPFRNTQILLLDEQGAPVPSGEIGEIYVAGSCLALGYYNQPERTRESFVPHPLNPIYPQTIYRTGDLGSWGPDGNLYFHGRKDFQIKHMGHRVELGEIEGLVRQIPTITDCCCLYHHEKEQIWLFYAGEGVSAKQITVFLRERLPGFMVPRKYQYLEQFPRQINGKIDLQQLKVYMDV